MSYHTSSRRISSTRSTERPTRRRTRVSTPVNQEEEQEILNEENNHTTEDTGIAIGECLKKASKKFVGIKRYAHAMIPMDETLTRVAIDVSNRPYLIWKVKLKVEKLGEMDTELFKEWFQAFSQSAGVTLHIENIYGENSHHKIESCYKGLARSLKDALAIDKRIKNSIPSTKGSI